jgi:HPt (histidine-containing phosphotransfer) domain-containing protein
MTTSPLVDHGRLQMLCAGDAALRAELAELFVTEATRHVKNAASAAAAANADALAKAAHVLGGAANNIGASRLGRLANQAEDRAKTGEVPGDLIDEIVRVFDETRVELARASTT